MSRIVTPDCERPNRMDGTCFYCYEPIGGLHKDDCVCFTKKVKVRAIIEYEIEVPNFWGKGNIEFHRNEGSWCSSNIIEELEALDKKDCLCGCTTFEFVSDVN